MQYIVLELGTKVMGRWKVTRKIFEGGLVHKQMERLKERILSVKYSALHWSIIYKLMISVWKTSWTPKRSGFRYKFLDFIRAKTIIVPVK